MIIDITDNIADNKDINENDIINNFLELFLFKGLLSLKKKLKLDVI